MENNKGIDQRIWAVEQSIRLSGVVEPRDVSGVLDDAESILSFVCEDL